MKLPSKLLWKCYFFVFAWSTLGECASLFYTGSDTFIYYHIISAFLPKMHHLYGIAVTTMLIDSLCLIPLFGYAFNRPIKSPRIWQTLFFIRIIGEIVGKHYDHLYLSSVISSNTTTGVAATLFLILFLLPSYMGHYQYAFRPASK
jgi:hypothetical protein